ncbi:MAG: UDP-glucose 4-epimerase [Sulfitobacter sp.]|nr:MAG: UDP-glucose 4-epimerase [Sulfitobacter sp.]
MRVLVTGNLGYIGTVLVAELLDKGYQVVGLDAGYYADCLLGDCVPPDVQILKDIRHINAADFAGVDMVVHLAALSNDPLGELAPGLTEDINLMGTLQAAKAAKEAGVKRFIYSSSQSMYGVSDTDQELDEDTSTKNPVTAYARTKWDAECRLNDLCAEDFVVVHFRPSTVFGASPRLRCDIVFNNLVACAYTTGRIEIKSDGTPWRPVVHIKDVCAAYIAGLTAPSELVSKRAFNVGIPDGNFTVRDLAEAAQKSVPGSELVFTGEHGNDSRTYRVGFDRILSELKGFYSPQWDLLKGGQELVQFFDRVGFDENTFRGPICTRLQKIDQLLENDTLDKELYFNADQ